MQQRVLKPREPQQLSDLLSYMLIIAGLQASHQSAGRPALFVEGNVARARERPAACLGRRSTELCWPAAISKWAPLRILDNHGLSRHEQATDAAVLWSV